MDGCKNNRGKTSGTKVDENIPSVSSFFTIPSFYHKRAILHKRATRRS